MPPTVRSSDIRKGDMQFHIEVEGERVRFYGKLLAVPDDGIVTFIAAAPVDRRASHWGSGLPFMSREQALFGTPNEGDVAVERDGSFSISLETPAAFYAGLGTVLVPPTLFLTYLRKGKRISSHVPVDDPVAFRFGTYPAQFTAGRKGPEFYRAAVPQGAPRTQEQILRASAYPADNLMPRNFWGSRPPV